MSTVFFLFFLLMLSAAIKRNQWHKQVGTKFKLSVQVLGVSFSPIVGIKISCKVSCCLSKGHRWLHSKQGNSWRGSNSEHCSSIFLKINTLAIVASVVKLKLLKIWQGNSLSRVNYRVMKLTDKILKITDNYWEVDMATGGHWSTNAFLI